MVTIFRNAVLGIHCMKYKDLEAKGTSTQNYFKRTHPQLADIVETTGEITLYTVFSGIKGALPMNEKILYMEVFLFIRGAPYRPENTVVEIPEGGDATMGTFCSMTLVVFVKKNTTTISRALGFVTTLCLVHARTIRHI